MNVDGLIAELRDRKELLDQAILSLERLETMRAGHRGRSRSVPHSRVGNHNYSIKIPEPAEFTFYVQD